VSFLRVRGHARVSQRLRRCLGPSGPGSWGEGIVLDSLPDLRRLCLFQNATSYGVSLGLEIRGLLLISYNSFKEGCTLLTIF
jgi:hypothetical protein